jgi:hypothetical protein
MKTAYLDWNVFNKIENHANNEELYSNIKDFIISGAIIVPYSNAHISDLYRGYLKNPNYIAGHIENIALLTNQL